MINLVRKLSSKNKWILTSVLFLLVTLPRFNDNKIVVKNTSYDSKYFIAYVEYFRGEVPSQSIRPASNWRLFVPFVASILPFSANTSINCINLICLAFALYFLFQTLKNLAVDETISWISLWLFIFSFPTFYYSTIAYVDPGILLFISIAVFATIIQNNFMFLASLAIGLLAKETILLVLPFYFFYTVLQRKKPAYFFSFIAFFIFIIGNVLLRKYAPTSSGESNSAFWEFSGNAFQLNFNRLHSWLSFPLSFGIVGVLYLYVLFKLKKNIFSDSLLLASLFSVMLALALYVASLFSTVADGRIIWHCYFFMLPAIAVYFSNNKLTN